MKCHVCKQEIADRADAIMKEGEVLVHLGQCHQFFTESAQSVNESTEQLQEVELIL